MICLPLDYMCGWLFGSNADRVKPEVRGRLIRYQRECYAVLSEALQDGRLTADSDIDIVSLFCPFGTSSVVVFVSTNTLQGEHPFFYTFRQRAKREE